MELDSYKDLIHRCFRCGYCKLPSDYSDYNCPPYNKFKMDSYSPGGRLWLIRALLNREIDVTKSLSDIFYSCTACYNCVEECRFEFKTEIMNMLIAGKTYILENSANPMIPGAAKTSWKTSTNTATPMGNLPKKDSHGSLKTPSKRTGHMMKICSCLSGTPAHSTPWAGK